MLEGDIALLQVAAAALLNLALAVCIGVLTSRVWLHSATTGWAGDVKMRLVATAKFAVVMMLLANLMLL